MGASLMLPQFPCQPVRSFLSFYRLLCLDLFLLPEMDNDLWGHLYFGREVLQGGKLPPRNLYSYTAPNHTWIIHEWLAEVFIFGIYHLFGSPGLVLLKVALGGRYCLDSKPDY